MAKNKFDEIVAFLQNYKHDGTPIILSQCETIIDFEKFVESHVSALRANSGNKTYKPYFDRISKLYDLLKK